MTLHSAPAAGTATPTEAPDAFAFPAVPGLRHLVPGQRPWETDEDGMAGLAEDARALVLPYSIATLSPMLTVDGLPSEAHDPYVMDLSDPDHAYDAAYDLMDGLEVYGSW